MENELQILALNNLLLDKKKIIIYQQEKIKKLEQRIKELEEHKMCDGCVDFNGAVCTDIDWCKRDNRLKDNFKAQEN